MVKRFEYNRSSVLDRESITKIERNNKGNIEAWDIHEHRVKLVQETSKRLGINIINAKVNSDKKYDYDKDEEIKSEIEKLEKEFDGNGRVLIRASGTEPLVRVMIEGENQNYIKQKAQTIANLIEQKLGDVAKN